MRRSVMAMIALVIAIVVAACASAPRAKPMHACATSNCVNEDPATKPAVTACDHFPCVNDDPATKPAVTACDHYPCVDDDPATKPAVTACETDNCVNGDPAATSGNVDAVGPIATPSHASLASTAASMMMCCRRATSARTALPLIRVTRSADGYDPELRSQRIGAGADLRRG